ncbi:anaerobic dehydrogenase [Clostridium aceticum]|uniref:Anaerobic dehydrogenase n=1 Tax=Clostridium aceticum TaxID=84022 RepID=A0A0D8IEL7_9CLOT|nr:molecular chaperone TorD family protein [Clostridium aceticum]AKL94354.1 anaerobic dehydrogenase [Clostridium aceticum]KJF28412.1 dehydrogenase [Clostridium aceticum]
MVNKLSSEEISILLEMRIFAYSFLKHALYIEPSREFLKAVIENNAVESFPFTEKSELINEGIIQINSFLKENNVLEISEYEKLHWDYTRMFIGPNSLPVPPWESVYLNKDRLVFQKETFEVRKNYLKYYFISKNYPREPDDHIGIELDFMCRLNKIAMENNEIQNTNKLLEVLNDQESFLREHILKWIPDFSISMINSSNTEFYRGIAKILKGYVEVDYLILKELIERST